MVALPVTTPPVLLQAKFPKLRKGGVQLLGEGETDAAGEEKDPGNLGEMDSGTSEKPGLDGLHR